MKGKPGRHVPAFVLLILAKKPAYGLQILNQLKEEMPYCRLDSAAVYRALNQLEDSGAIQVFEQSKEEDSSLDFALFKKYYSITALGIEELKTFYSDIEKRHANLSYFISTFSHLRKDLYDK
ncbi:PadR family transcriptional regulator [Fusibacter bizertensis]